MSKLDFSDCLKCLKDGYKLRRSGWNGKGMWIAMSKGITFDSANAREGSAKLLAEEVSTIETLPRIDLKMADGKLMIGWLPNHADLFSEDWEIVL